MENQSNKKAFIRYAALCLLTFQTTITVLCLRQSRVSRSPSAAASSSHRGGAVDKLLFDALKDDDEVYPPVIEVRRDPPAYFTSSLVLSTEVLKLIITLIFLSIQHGLNVIKAGRTIYHEVLSKPSETCKFAVPAILYIIQDNLVVFALTVLDAGTYQITYQIRILTTALLARIILQKQLKASQWTALVCLMAGVALVQIGQMDSGSGLSFDLSFQRMAGIIAVLCATVTSATAGIYNEKLFKSGKQPSLLLRNIQLSVFALIFAVLGCLLKDGANIRDYGLFYKFTPIVWVIVVLQAFGGLLVAMVIKYADNILKNFATSISIMLSCLYSYFFLNDLNLQPLFVLGASTVIFSTCLYAWSSSGGPSTSRSSSGSSGVDSGDSKSCNSDLSTVQIMTKEHLMSG